MRTHIHASGIRAAEDSKCLRPLGHRNRPKNFTWNIFRQGKYLTKQNQYYLVAVQCDTCRATTFATVHGYEGQWTKIGSVTYEGVSRSFRTGHLARKLQVVELSAIRCNFIAILWVSLVSFAAITLCTASQQVFIVVISLSTLSGNFWIPPRIHFSRKTGREETT